MQYSSLKVDRRLGGTCRFHLQGRRIEQQSDQLLIAYSAYFSTLKMEVDRATVTSVILYQIIRWHVPKNKLHSHSHDNLKSHMTCNSKKILVPMPCTSTKFHRCFGGINYFHLQGQSVGQVRYQQEASHLRYDPPKRRLTSTKLHYVTSQNTVLFVSCLRHSLGLCGLLRFGSRDNVAVMSTPLLWLVMAIYCTQSIKSQVPLPNSCYPYPLPMDVPLCYQSLLWCTPLPCGFMHNSILLNIAKRQYSNNLLLRMPTTPFFCYIFVLV
jgi:hypothetical protein